MPTEAVGFPRARVTGDCELPDMGARMEPRSSARAVHAFNWEHPPPAQQHLFLVRCGSALAQAPLAGCLRGGHHCFESDPFPIIMSTVPEIGRVWPFLPKPASGHSYCSSLVFSARGYSFWRALAGLFTQALCPPM